MFVTCCCVLSGHDPNDYEIGRRVGLPTINIMNKDGSLNAAAGEGSTAERGVTQGCGRGTWRVYTHKAAIYNAMRTLEGFLFLKVQAAGGALHLLSLFLY